MYIQALLGAEIRHAAGRGDPRPAEKTIRRDRSTISCRALISPAFMLLPSFAVPSFCPEDYTIVRPGMTGKNFFGKEYPSRRRNWRFSQ